MNPFTHKIKSVPSCAAEEDSIRDLSVEDALNESVSVKSNPSETQRRARTSAAMIGLAISMGASSLLLPQQGDEAMAAEPVGAEPTVTAPTSGEGATVARSPQSSEPEVVSVPTLSNDGSLSKTTLENPSGGTVIEHVSQPGDDVWKLSKAYQVEPSAIVASNRQLNTASVLPVGQVVKVPVVNGIVHEIQPGESFGDVRQAYKVADEQVPTTALTPGQTVTVPGAVNDLLKSRQETALDHLKQQRDRLQESLTSLRSEQSDTAIPVPSVLPQTETPAVVVSPNVNRVVPIEVANQVNIDPQGVSGNNEPVSLPNVNPIPAVAPTSVATIPPSTIASVDASGTGAKLYRVRRGDTIAAIARANGLTKAELIRFNNLDNPNLIKVDQEIRIPQAPTATVVPGINSTRNRTDRDRLVAAESFTPNLRVPVRPVGNPVMNNSINGNLNGNRSTAGATEILVPTPGVAIAPRNNAVDSNPYVSRLRDEISKMREVYRNQQNNTNNAEASPGRNLAVPVIPGVEPTATNLNSPSQPLAPALNRPAPTTAYNGPINPEFSPNSGNRNQTPIARSNALPMGNGGAVSIPVPPPINNPRVNRSWIAAAPSAGENYNPMVRPPVGQTVSPELPPLQGPNPYLPDSPMEFTGYIWPSRGVLTSGYGRRWGRMHRGIDIAAPVGTPIVAAAPGVVVYSRWNSGGYGNLVDIQHADGSLTRYAHNSRLLVREGQTVTQGQQIAEMGSTGFSTGPHLHFEIHPSGRGAVNPMALLPRRR